MKYFETIYEPIRKMSIAHSSLCDIEDQLKDILFKDDLSKKDKYAEWLKIQRVIEYVKTACVEVEMEFVAINQGSVKLPGNLRIIKV